MPAATAQATGTLDVLNCRAGDMKFSFNSDNPEEVEKARKVVTDMLKRGYILFVQDGDDEKNLRKVEAFDEKRDLYIVSDAPEPKRRGGRRKGIPAKTAKGTAIAPTAGG